MNGRTSRAALYLVIAVVAIVAPLVRTALRTQI